jgi:uncharacterized DUF497 family protein
MGVTISAGVVLFEWEEEKNRMNCLKHGMGFEEAIACLR